MEESKLRVASMFAGCGGLDYGFHHNKDFTMVYVNDIDKDACKTYARNFQYEPVCEDIKLVTSIPNYDIMLGGFPCQGFSVANKYRSEGDSRNELYKELIRLLRMKSPRYFVFENVKGILSIGGYETKEDKRNGHGKVFKLIKQELEDCGYQVHTKLFKMKYYDIPQNRERVIFLGLRKDIKFSFTWPCESKTITKTLRDAIGDLPIEYDPKIQHVGTNHKVKINGFLGNRKLEWDQVSPTITGRGGGTGGPVINVHPSGQRRMTVREYARIQTFPDNFAFEGSISSMYRQIGNAVPPRFSEYLTNLISSIHTSVKYCESEQTEEYIA
jgi:DNA (cytosine-5)-methyltransferase 1